MLLGKAICPNFGVYGDFGYRTRANDVPDDLFGSAGVYVTWRSITLSGGYRHVQGLSGGDIGDPGFGTTFGFPQTKEIQQSVEASLGFTDPGGRHYALFGAKSVAGRNTGDKCVIGLAASFPF